MNNPLKCDYFVAVVRPASSYDSSEFGNGEHGENVTEKKNDLRQRQTPQKDAKYYEALK